MDEGRWLSGWQKTRRTLHATFRSKVKAIVSYSNYDQVTEMQSSLEDCSSLMRCEA